MQTSPTLSRGGLQVLFIISSDYQQRLRPLYLIDATEDVKGVADWWNINPFLRRSYFLLLGSGEREREKKKRGEEHQGREGRKKKKKNIGGESKKDSLNKRYELYKRINPLFNLTMETVGYTCTLINKWVKSNSIFRDHCRLQ